MIKIEFAKDWAQIFEKAGLESFEDFFEFSAGQTINKNKKREVIAMTLDTAGGIISRIYTLIMHKLWDDTKILDS